MRLALLQGQAVWSPKEIELEGPAKAIAELLGLKKPDPDWQPVTMETIRKRLERRN